VINRVFGQYHQSPERYGTIVDRYRASVYPSEHLIYRQLSACDVIDKVRRWQRGRESRIPL